MAVTTLISAKTAAETSTAFTVAEGESAKISLYTTDAGGLPPGAYVDVYEVTPGNDRYLFSAYAVGATPVISDGGQYKVAKPVSAIAYGAFTGV